MTEFDIGDRDCSEGEADAKVAEYPVLWMHGTEIIALTR